MSVSPATVEMLPDPGWTWLHTEQGVFLDGMDTPEGRREGSEWMLDSPGNYLAPRTAA